MALKTRSILEGIERCVPPKLSWRATCWSILEGIESVLTPTPHSAINYRRSILEGIERAAVNALADIKGFLVQKHPRRNWKCMFKNILTGIHKKHPRRNWKCWAWVCTWLSWVCRLKEFASSRAALYHLAELSLQKHPRRNWNICPFSWRRYSRLAEAS